MIRAHVGQFGIHRATLGLVFALLLTSIVAVGQATSVSADVSVTINNFAFNPTPLTVPVGTKVVWTNQQPQVPHTVTSDMPGVFDSGTIQSGGTFSFTFMQAGTVTYHCTIHPNMHGTVIVTAAATASSSVTPSSVAAPGGSQPAALPSTGAAAFADPAFQQLWAKTDANPNGHSYVWGPNPFTNALTEDYKEAAGGKRTVQYFDKARMELGPNNTVTAGLLSVELITGKQQNGDATFVSRDPANITVAGDPDNPFPTYANLTNLQAAEQDNSGSGAPVTKMVGPNGATGTYAPATSDVLAKTTGYDAATKHNIPKAFLDFRNAPNLGGVQAIGLAITEPVWANVKVGGKVVPVLVQAFERRVLTYTPSNPAGFMVEYGNIGQHYYKWRTSAPSPNASPTGSTVASPATIANPPAPMMPGGNSGYGGSGGMDRGGSGGSDRGGSGY